jgi:hypothetical protein
VVLGKVFIGWKQDQGDFGDFEGCFGVSFAFLDA